MPTPSIEEKTERAMMGKTLLIMLYLKHYSALLRGQATRGLAVSAEEWVRGDVHTNSIEGFWNLLKRGIGGVYHSVSEKYLQSYINEYGFRYNHHKDTKPMFLTVLEKI